MDSRFRQLFGVLFFLLVASCSGGGCSSCAGSTPLPGGFPKEKAVDNAGMVRVSRPGLDFVEKALPTLASKVSNAPGGVLSIDIPTLSTGKTTIADLGFLGSLNLTPTVCPDGPSDAGATLTCHADVNIGKGVFQIDAVKPNVVSLHGTLPLVLTDTPVHAAAEYATGIGTTGLGGITLFLGYGDGDCVDGVPKVTPHALPIGITLPIVEETTVPRNGYAKIDVNNAVIDLSGLSTDDVKVCSTCGFATSACQAITDSSFVKGLVVNPLKTGLESQVKTILASQLCTAPSATVVPACPTGTSPDADGKYCVFDTDKAKCVSTVLGLSSHIDLGALLASISPGTPGGVDFSLAAGGAMQPFPKLDANISGRTPNGLTLGLLGGVIPQPPSKCVPQATLTPPTGIPLPDVFAPTAADPGTAPHVGIGLAGRFLDYALGNVYNSGLLCLGISSEQIDLLRTGLVSLIIPSLKTLTFEEADAAAAINTRPQMPPTVKIGGGTSAADPLLTITMPKFALDFYVWHLDRFVRVFTYQADLTVPVNLQTSKDGITPQLGDIGVANGSVTNADLLMDDPVALGTSLTGLIGSLGKQLIGNGFSPINPASALSSLGLGLEITQITKLTKGTDDFVGMFATLSQTGMAATMEMDTKAVFVSKKVPVDHMQLTTLDPANLPELVIELSAPNADAQHPAEYAWWIDKGTRSAWSADAHLVVRDNQLLLQGHHVLHVAARTVGQASSEDATPAEIPFTIDALAPFVDLERKGTVVTVKAHDVVSTDDKLLGRYRLNGNAFGAWQPLSALASIKVLPTDALDVEVKDEEGNVRSTSEALRGNNDGTLGGSSCGCSTPGRTTESGSGLAAVLLAVAAFGFVVIRRRGGLLMLSKSGRLMLAAGSIGAVAATSQGCGCGSDDSGGTGCGSDCNQTCQDALGLGLPGSYTSLAKASDGTLWVAGYNDALLSDGDSDLFGDLVVGKYDGSKVQWQTVDGLPARTDGTCADRPKDSWRNGEVDSGDDVGLWTSIQVAGDGRPMVSYYDASNKQLKFAVGPSADAGWNTFVLRAPPASGDAGRYSKMVLVGGKPVVAFLQVENGNAGKIRSKVVIARANSAVPADGSDFSFEDAAVEEANPCSSTSCAGNTACVKSTGTCTPKVTGCTPADCGTGKACVTDATTMTAACVATKGATQTYPDVFGDYISLAESNGALGMVVYDRPHGNLIALADLGGGNWAKTIADGETGSRTDNTALDTGDTGVAASLVIDSAGVWHVTYVSGLDETLRYLSITGGKVGAPEIIDDGSSADGKAFADGKHLVGDDSAISVDGDNLTVYYQDATIGTLHKATGAKTGAQHKWTVTTVSQPDKFAGYFPRVVPGESKVANFWEATDRANHTRTGDVSILSP